MTSPMEEDEGVGLTDSICVIVDLGAGVDVLSEAGVTLGGWVARVLDVVERVVDVDVDVEFWLVLIVLPNDLLRARPVKRD